MPHKVADGTIKVSKNGVKYIKVNGKWEYMKKPREEWKTPLPKPKKKVEYNYPPLRIPDNMRETQYSGYYITEDGKAYRAPGKYDRNGQHGEINEYGLIYLKPSYRGHPGRPEYQYESINISIRDKDGKFLKQIKKSIHQLVAEVFVPNPEGYNEILHLDDNNRNNHYTNLKWGTHLENMSTVYSPATVKKSYTITDIIEGKMWEGYNLSNWIRDNYELLESRSGDKKYKVGEYVRKFSKARSQKYNTFGFKIEY